MIQTTHHSRSEKHDEPATFRSNYAWPQTMVARRCGYQTTGENSRTHPRIPELLPDKVRTRPGNRCEN